MNQRNSYTFLVRALMLVYLSSLQLLAQEGVPGLLPLVDSNDGGLKATALQVHDSGEIFVLSTSSVYENEVSFFITNDSLAGPEVLPVTLVVDARNRNSLSLLAAAAEVPFVEPDPALIAGLKGWNVVTYSDASGATLPTLTAYPLELSPEQIARFRVLPLALPASGSSPPAGGLIFKDSEFVGYAVQDGSVTWRRSQVVQGQKSSHPELGPPRRLVGLKLYNLSAFERVLMTPASSTGAIVSLERQFESLSWPDGEPDPGGLPRRLELRVKPVHISKRLVSFQLSVEVDDYKSRGKPLAVLPFEPTSDAGVYECLVNLEDLFVSQDAVEVELRVGESVLRGVARNAYLKTRSGGGMLSRLPDARGRYHAGGYTYTADVFVGIEDVVDEKTEESLLSWDEVESIMVKKPRQQFPRLKLTAEGVVDGKTTKLGELRYAPRHDPSGGVHAYQDRPISHSLALRDYEFEVKLASSTQFRMSGNGERLVSVNDQHQVMIRDRKNLLEVGRINCASAPEVAETHQFDMNYLYLLEVGRQRVLRYDLNTGAFIEGLSREDLRVPLGARIVRIVASPLAVDEVILFLENADSQGGIVMRVDSIEKKVRFMRSLSRQEMYPFQNKCFAYSPYLVEAYGGRSVIQLTGDGASISLEEEHLPYREFSGGFGDIDVRFGVQQFESAYINTMVDGFRGGLAPFQKSGRLQRGAKAEYRDSAVKDFHLVEAPVHFVSGLGEIFKKELPVYSNHDPVVCEILVGPAEYALSEENELILSKSLVPSNEPDFILIRSTNAVGNSIEFWVSVDRSAN